MSGYLMEQPLVIQGVKEEAQGTFGNVVPMKFLPTSRNYAGDAKSQEYFNTEIYPVMVWTRQDRQGLETEWDDIRNMTAMKHDEGRRYFGRSDSYMPIYKKERTKQVSTIVNGVFPSDEYFDVTDRGTGDPERAKPTKVIMQWELETNAQIRTKMKANVGQLVDFGTAPLKYWYKKEIRSEGNAVSRLSALQNLMGAPTHQFKNYCKEGLAISPRNLFYWYIYPSTAESLETAVMVFEDIDIPIAMAEMMMLNKRWLGVEDIVAQQAADNIPEHDRARLSLLMQRGEGMGVPGEGMARSKLGSQLTASEIWTFMPLPANAYLPHERRGMPLPVLITAFGNVAVEIRRNPFYHQRPPYAVGRIDWEPGLFYGNAQGRIIRPMQLLVNDFMNQTNDNGIMALNPMSIWDINKMTNMPTTYFPGAAWYSQGNPNEAVKFDRPPNDQVQMGMTMTNMLMGLAENAGGAPPDYGSKARAAGTATGMSIAQRNVQGPINETVRDIENDQMLPILINGWKNNIQYRNEDVMVSIAGEMIRVSPEMLMIDAEFRYLASSQAMNQQMRTQQMLSLVQMITPVVPMILQQGYIVDFVALFKRVWTDGFGLRGFTDFIKKGQAAPQMGPPRPDQRGGLVAEQQQNYQSAMSQVEGAFSPEAEPVPDDGSFGAVRDGADAMAAGFGGMGSMGGIQ